jgi:hypothetical protein
VVATAPDRAHFQDMPILIIGLALLAGCFVPRVSLICGGLWALAWWVLTGGFLGPANLDRWVIILLPLAIGFLIRRRANPVQVVRAEIVHRPTAAPVRHPRHAARPAPAIRLRLPPPST